MNRFQKIPHSLSLQTLKHMGIMALVFILNPINNAAMADEFYKWVDENGVTHYTQTPPKGISTEKIRASGTKVNQDEAAKARKRLDNSRTSFLESAKQRKVTEGVAEEEKEEALKVAKYCEDARNNLKVLNEHARIKEKGTDGEYKVLSEEEKQSRVAKNQKHVKEFCK